MPPIKRESCQWQVSRTQGRKMAGAMFLPCAADAAHGVGWPSAGAPVPTNGRDTTTGLRPVVSKCALREKKEGVPVSRNAQRFVSDNLPGFPES